MKSVVAELEVIQGIILYAIDKAKDGVDVDVQINAGAGSVEITPHGDTRRFKPTGEVTYNIIISVMDWKVIDTGEYDD